MLRFVLVALLGAGCGLVNSNSADIALNLPPQQFTIDTSGWQISQDTADAYLGTPCTASADVCATAVASACSENCAGTCDATSQTCDLTLEVAAYQTVNLLSSQPSLATIANDTGVTIVIDSAQYAVTDNTLSIATPPVTLYVGPMTATQPSDPGTIAIATIDPVAAHAVVAAQNLAFTATGEPALETELSDFNEPFNVIAGASIVLENGDSLPTGKLDATVTINAHAHP